MTGSVHVKYHCYNAKRELALPREIRLLNHIRKHSDMIDWNLVAKIAGGGFGMTVLVLAILLGVIWLIGFMLQRKTKRDKE